MKAPIVPTSRLPQPPNAKLRSPLRESPDPARKDMTLINPPKKETKNKNPKPFRIELFGGAGAFSSQPP